MAFPALDITWAVFRSYSSFSPCVLFFNDKFLYYCTLWPIDRVLYSSYWCYFVVDWPFSLSTFSMPEEGYGVIKLWCWVLLEKLKTARMDSNTNTSIFNQYLLAILSCFCICSKLHCVKSAQIRNFFWSVFSRIWTEYEDLRSRTYQYLIDMVRNQAQYWRSSFHSCNMPQVGLGGIAHLVGFCVAFLKEPNFVFRQDHCCSKVNHKEWLLQLTLVNHKF